MSSARIEQIHGYVPAYDLVRGLASLAVFLAHLKPIIFALLGKENDDSFQYAYFEIFGILGVEFFFALSGLLLGPILYKQFQKDNVKDNLKIFLMRRWFRTLPTYYLGFALFFIVFTLQGMEIPDYWPSYLVFLQTPFELQTMFFPVSWSLSIEELFYILFPLVCLIIWGFTKSPDKAFIATVAIITFICFVTRCYGLSDFEAWHREVQRGFVFRLDSIGLGVLVGVYARRISKPVFYASLGFIVVVSGYVFFSLFDFGHSFEKAIIAQIILTFLPLACAVFIQYLALNTHIKKNGLITFFADISYPLYIFHLGWLHVFFGWSFIPILPLLFIYIGFTLWFSYAFYKYVETPILKRRPSYKDT